MTEPRAICRPDDKGRPDDIYIECDAIRLERMGRNTWYLGVHRGDKCVKFAVRATKKACRIEVEPYDDELGLVDDSADRTPERIEAEVAAARA